MTQRLRRYRIFLLILLFLDIVAIGLFVYFGIFARIPNDIKLFVNKEEYFNFDVPVEASFEDGDISVLQVNKSNIPTGELNLDFTSPFSMKSSKTGIYKLQLKLFGLFEYDTISVEVLDEIEVIPGGSTIGLTLETEGVLVLGHGKIVNSDGISVEPSRDILNTSDYIVYVNSVKIKSKEQLIELIQENGANKLQMQVKRNNVLIDTTVTPVRTADGSYKIGLWIRDDTQGIGTLTFITADGNFGALGHGIVDVDTGLLIEIGSGEAFTSEIVNIKKGVSGTPGELTGIIHRNENDKIGNLICNTPQGIFGKTTKSYNELNAIIDFEIENYMGVAFRQEIKPGAAYILCAVDGTIKKYNINIDSIDLSNTNHSKGMTITITDEELIEKTGGIVQGMSGSPIIQNGKLIGAVTHVFIRDSKRGYGVFIENMLNRSEIP